VVRTAGSDGIFTVFSHVHCCNWEAPAKKEGRPVGRAAVVDRINTDDGTLDLLVNNADAAWDAPLSEFPEVGFEKVMNINLQAPFMRELNCPRAIRVEDDVRHARER